MSDIHVERESNGNLHALVRGSSNVIEFHYDPNEEVLDITYKGGRVYRYELIPEYLVNDLCEAKSVGTWINANLVGIYEAKKL